MGEINKRSNSYRELTAQGVSITELVCLSFQQGLWKVTCRKLQSTSREAAKSAINGYLSREFQAKDLDHYAKRASIDTQFQVVFRSFAL